MLTSVKNIVAINFAGSVGKTTLAKHVLVPMMGNCLRVQIESINNSAAGADVEMDARHFDDLAEKMLLRDTNLVIDIGGSNVESTLSKMSKMAGIQDEIDRWIVPVDERTKVITDTLNTIKYLVNELLIEPSKITVVANNVEFPDEMKSKFAILFKASEVVGFNFSDYSIMKSDLFDAIKDDKRTVFEIVSDTTNYRLLIAQEQAADKNEAKLAEYTRALRHQMQAKSIVKNIQGVWANSMIAA